MCCSSLARKRCSSRRVDAAWLAAGCLAPVGCGAADHASATTLALCVAKLPACCLPASPWAPTLCLQAVLALRDMLLSRWAGLGREVQQGTLQFLLQTALAGGMQGRPVLRAQVWQAGRRARPS